MRQPIRSPEFWEDYNAALRGEVPTGVLLRGGARPAPTSRVKPQTTRWLIQEYKKSAAFRGLDLQTQHVRANILDRFCEAYGDWPYAGLDRPAVVKLRDKRAETPGAANELVKVLRQVFKVAVEYGYHDSNPAAEVAFLSSKNSEGFHAWTVKEVEQFEKTHPVGTKVHLVLALAMYGGCARRSDIVRLGKQHMTKDGSRLQYTQFKGRNSENPSHIDIPVIPELRRIIGASPCGDLTFLVTEFGRPFSAKGFGNRFKKYCVDASLSHCSVHGLRKAAAARLAELGCTDLEIMAIGGWKTLKEVQRYTKGARKRVLSNNAMDKVQADIEGTEMSNLASGGKKVRR